MTRRRLASVVLAPALALGAAWMARPVADAARAPGTKSQDGGERSALGNARPEASGGAAAEQASAQGGGASSGPSAPTPAPPKQAPPSAPASPRPAPRIPRDSTGPAPPPTSSASGPAGPGIFVDVAKEVGIDFHHFVGATGQWYFPEIMGPGCAFLDYDGDGDLDVLLIDGKVLEPGKKDADAIYRGGGPGPHTARLFRNELISKTGPAGKLRFTDVTKSSGIGIVAYGMGVATGDYDNDGDVDVYFANFGPDVLMRNNGDGTFTDVTAGSGLGDPRWDTSASWVDMDNDGRLDLAVVAYCDFTVATHKKCFMESGAREYCGPKAYLAVPARLYRNLGGGKFEDVTAKMGLDAAYGHGLGVVAVDVDGDGWQDLYVANDSDANILWMSSHAGFADDALLRGAAYNEHGIPSAGMGIAVGDWDEDGDVDLFVTNLIGESNTLYENQGGGHFEDASSRAGLSVPSLRFTGFGVGWFDADNDGDLDLFIANGDVRLVESEAGRPFPYRQPNQLMRKDGTRYADRSKESGPGLALNEVSRGAAFGDVDNDGDVDILVSNDNGHVRLLENRTPASARWIEVRLLDGKLGRDAFGGKVALTLKSGRTLTRWVHTDGSYLSATDPRLHFAWPENDSPGALVVTLPGGKPWTVEGVTAGKVSTIVAGAEGAALRP